MSKQTVIVSGGMVEKDFALSILKSEETEFVIGVDRGLVFLYDNEIKPDYIVGDFDSVPNASSFFNVTVLSRSRILL